MALLFMEGFDSYTNNADIRENPALNVTSTSDLAVTGNASGRIDGRCVDIGDSSSYILDCTVPKSNATFYCGFAFWQESQPTVDANLIGFGQGGRSNQITIYEKGVTGLLEVRRGTSTVLGTTTGSVSSNPVWNYIVIKVLLNDTTGTVELWLNGTKELDLTSQDTLGTTTAEIDVISLYGENAYDRHFDDLYFGDTTGSDMTDQQGDCHIIMVSPDANGTTNNWTKSSGTNNYEMVDEGQPDDDTTYVYSSTVTDKDLYGCAALTGNIGTVHAVQVKSTLRKEGAGYREIKAVCRSNVTEVDGTATPVGTEYTTVDHIYENDPNGGGNWTESAVNSAEIGFKIFS